MPKPNELVYSYSQTYRDSIAQLVPCGSEDRTVQPLLCLQILLSSCFAAQDIEEIQWHLRATLMVFSLFLLL
jgi:hypothetical protein